MQEKDNQVSMCDKEKKRQTTLKTKQDRCASLHRMISIYCIREMHLHHVHNLIRFWRRGSDDDRC